MFGFSMTIIERTVHLVEHNGESYERWGPDTWEKSYGESMEPVHHPEELEAAFQLALFEPAS